MGLCFLARLKENKIIYFKVFGPNNEDFGTFHTLSNAIKNCEERGYGIVTSSMPVYLAGYWFNVLNLKTMYKNGPRGKVTIHTPIEADFKACY